MSANVHDVGKLPVLSFCVGLLAPCLNRNISTGFRLVVFVVVVWFLVKDRLTRVEKSSLFGL